VAKTLYVIRGLPGSGKSTLGEKLCPGRCFSADQFFETDGVYKFVGAKIPQAHAFCQENVRDAMSDGEDVAVANTFTRESEMLAYFNMASHAGYQVFVLSCENSFGNVHGVPEEAIVRMSNRWQNYYGGE
jgi:predicted kinase